MQSRLSAILVLLLALVPVLAAPAVHATATPNRTPRLLCPDGLTGGTRSQDASAWCVPTADTAFGNGNAILTGDTLYVLSGVGVSKPDDVPPQLQAIDPWSGGERWSTEFDATALLIGPVAGTDTVYLCQGTEEPGDATVVALESDDGHERWRARIAVSAPEPGGCSSLVFDPDGRVIVVSGGGVHALDAADGDVDWSTPDLALMPETRAAFGDETVYLNGETALLALASDTGEVRWVFDRGEAPPGTLRAPAAAAGRVVVYEDASKAGGRNGVLRALNASDGLLLWHAEMVFTATSAMPAPLVSDGFIALLGRTVAIVDADDGGVLWQRQTFRGAPFGRVALEGGVVYVPDSGSLAVYDARTGAEIRVVELDLEPGLPLPGAGVIYILGNTRELEWSVCAILPPTNDGTMAMRAGPLT